MAVHRCSARGFLLGAAAFLVFAAPAACRAQALTTEDVGGIISRAVQEAKARKTPATIAVVDRQGAVLAVYQMSGAPGASYIANNPNGTGDNRGLNGVNPIPTVGMALAKAMTAAYLSTSVGNAFSTRTASQIVQDHFDPGTINASSGPLYGVQFSALPCSDLSVHGNADDPSSMTRGPHRSPVGLAGDPGGLPLYKNGALVGGIGVKAVGPYTIVTDTQSTAQNTDELIALAGTIGLQAPTAIMANNITVGGLLLTFSNAVPADLLSNPSKAPGYATLPNDLVSVPTYYDAAGGLRAGSSIGTVASGIVQDTSGLISTVEEPNLLVDGNGANRYPIVAGAPSAGSLTQAETLQIMRSAYAVALEARAQLRPAGMHVAVTISIVDVVGNVLGLTSVPDAALFGVDVSLQKARSAAFLSDFFASYALQQHPYTAVFDNAATAAFGRPVFAEGFAWSEREIGNIARDTLPDGINGSPNGPLSLSAALTTPFADGLQEALIAPNIVQHLCFLQAANPPAYCAGVNTSVDTPVCAYQSGPGSNILADGLQVFPGGFPIYRNGQLIGGIGVSGDGVQQDDLVGFLGLYNAGIALNNGIGNAPISMRANTLTVKGVRPVYVDCPTDPFVSGGVENVCSNK